MWVLKSPQIRTLLLNDVRKPTKSVKSSKKTEEQALGGLYTLAITVDTVVDLGMFYKIDLLSLFINFCN